jgi:methylated-DNA-[protein]-cysteine S-methyltransferase
MSWAEFEKRYKKIVPGNWQEIDAESKKALQAVVRSLDGFFKAGKPLDTDFPMSPKGTSFQLKVWNELLKIPAGNTTTYGEIAETIGSPGAARAVGTACGANPIPLFVPCHRVIGANGNLCGFGGGGINVKRKLLSMEKEA